MLLRLVHLLPKDYSSTFPEELRLKSPSSVSASVEEKILRMRFGVGGEPEHTLEEIGEKFNLSRERIRQIETSALRRIRTSDDSLELRGFLYEEAV